MSEETKSVSDATQSVGDTQGEGKEKESVQYDTYKRTLSQLKKVQDGYKSLEEELNILREEKKSAEERKLAEQNEYKKLLEIRTGELQKVAEERNSILMQMQDSIKLHAFLEKLPGKIKRPEYYNFVPLDDIVVDPETRMVDGTSLEQAVSAFMDQHGSDLVDKGNVGKLPSTAGNPTAPIKPGGTPEQRLKAAVANLVMTNKI